MRIAKGFGKNYFRLSAITATANAITMHATSSRVHSFHQFSCNYDELDALEELEELESLLEQDASLKACHCNSFFLAHSRKILKTFFYKKLHVDYFKTLFNSISPPIRFLKLDRSKK